MITNYFIKKKIETLAAASAGRAHHSLPLDEARTLLVFCDWADREAVERLVEPERQAGRTVTLCLLVPAGENAEAELHEKKDTRLAVFAKSDLNAWGFPLESVVERVNALPADILIDITRPGCYPLQYLALRHPGRFKVGIKYPGQEWYDMGLSPADNEDIGYLFGQLLFYLHSIHAK